MPQVTCPRCGTRQSIDDDVNAYTCIECGAAWEFAVCENCGVRFHMRPGTADWTCPECGHEHGSATMAQLTPDLQPEPVERLAPAHARPEPARRSRRPPSRFRLAVIAIVGIVSVLAIAFALSSFGEDGEAIATQSPSVALTSTEALCLHLRDLQTPREDALTRLAETLKADATTFKAEGNTQLAADVLRMRKAVLDYVDALVAHGDTSVASAEVADALTPMPC
jgi:transcription elongation factor Elf1